MNGKLMTVFVHRGLANASDAVKLIYLPKGRNHLPIQNDRLRFFGANTL